MIGSLVLLALASFGGAAYLDKRQGTSTVSSSSTQVPDYFMTTTDLYPGPTATGRAPFLAQSNPAPFGPPASFVANSALETAFPIAGDTTNTSIFMLMGQLSPYFPNPSGFGVQEYPLPKGANITEVQMLSRHGSRYPTSNSSIEAFAKRIVNATKAGTNFTGALSFLNPWSYQLGSEILVPVGRRELFDSGVLHYYQYGQLYNPKTKIIARTTTQDRMLKSAENFMAGFFGLEWTNNATLEVIIEGAGFNNSLAGYDNCNNSNLPVSQGGVNASAIWENIYLANATQRLKALAGGYKWTVSDSYNAQTLCPYETEYSVDLQFAGGYGFQSPVGRAVGIGYVREVLARLQNHVLTTPTAQDNITLDNNTTTFPLNQSLYFDFSHDTNIASVLTAFGLKQFSQFLPPTGPPPNQQLIISHLEPFGARLDIEVIKTPQPVSANRSTSTPYTPGPPTTYVHFIINQRTLPLGVSLPACGDRMDGWCELSTFLATQSSSLALANYEYACNGRYPAVPYGNVTNGAP